MTVSYSRNSNGHESFDTRQEFASFLQDLQQGFTLEQAIQRLATNLVLGNAELNQKLTKIQIVYELKPDGLYINGRSYRDLIDPNRERVTGIAKVGDDLTRRLLEAERQFLTDRNLAQAFVMSPDIGFGRNYLYEFRRDPKDPSRILFVAHEHVGTLSELGKFVQNITGIPALSIIDGNPTFSNSYLSQAVSATQIHEAAMNSFSRSRMLDPKVRDYIERETRTHATFAQILIEQQRQIQALTLSLTQTFANHQSIHAALGAIMQAVDRSLNGNARIDSISQALASQFSSTATFSQNFSTTPLRMRELPLSRPRDQFSLSLTSLTRAEATTTRGISSRASTNTSGDRDLSPKNQTLPLPSSARARELHQILTGQHIPAPLRALRDRAALALSELGILKGRASPLVKGLNGSGLKGGTQIPQSSLKALSEQGRASKRGSASTDHSTRDKNKQLTSPNIQKSERGAFIDRALKYSERSESLLHRIQHRLQAYLRLLQQKVRQEQLKRVSLLKGGDKKIHLERGTLLNRIRNLATKNLVAIREHLQSAYRFVTRRLVALRERILSLLERSPLQKFRAVVTRAFMHLRERVRDGVSRLVSYLRRSILVRLLKLPLVNRLLILLARVRNAKHIQNTLSLFLQFLEDLRRRGKKIRLIRFYLGYHTISIAEDEFIKRECEEFDVASQQNREAAKDNTYLQEIRSHAALY